MRHTSEYIASMLLNTCKKWGIKSDRVTTVVTDNAVNMVNAHIIRQKETYTMLRPHLKLGRPVCITVRRFAKYCV